MAVFQFTKLIDFADDFLKTGDDIKKSKWPVPLDVVTDLQIARRGIFGKYIVERFCKSAKLDVLPCPPEEKNAYDWIINGLRVEVKIAFESKRKEWTFNRIYDPDNYDYLCCIGVLPNRSNSVDGKCFLINRDEVQELIDKKKLGVQRESWMLKFDAGTIPIWYKGDATIDKAIEIFRKCSKDQYASSWGEVVKRV